MDYAAEEEEEKGVRERERERERGGSTREWWGKTCGEAADPTDLSSLI